MNETNLATADAEKAATHKGLLGETILAALRGERGDDQKRIAETAVAWTELLLRKNQDYGSSAWQHPLLAPTLPVGMAIRVRMSDKISRLMTLLAGGGPSRVSDETIDDTLRDLGAYCLLYLSRPQEKTELPPPTRQLPERF